MTTNKPKQNNLKKITDLKEVQKIELDILKELDAYCKKNSLTFFLQGGTLLGAVRHKGFIPWDDDVDVMMFRDDYEKLLKGFNKKGGRYRVMTYKNTPGYFYPFAKIVDTKTAIEEEQYNGIEGLGMYIDIFPIDNMTRNRLATHWFFFKKRFYLVEQHIVSGAYKRIKSKSIAKNILGVLSGPVSKIIPVNYPARKIDELSKKYSNKEETGLIYIAAILTYQELMPKTHLVDPVMLPFEDSKFTSPRLYKEYLTQIYGDYMQLPPVEKRKSPHVTNFYWKTTD